MKSVEHERLNFAKFKLYTQKTVHKRLAFCVRILLTHGLASSVNYWRSFLLLLVYYIVKFVISLVVCCCIVS